MCPAIFGNIWDCIYLASAFHDIGIFLSILCQVLITQRKRKLESYKILHTWNGKVIRPKSTQKESMELLFFQWWLTFVSNSVIFLPNSTSFKNNPIKAYNLAHLNPFLTILNTNKFLRLGKFKESFTSSVNSISPGSVMRHSLTCILKKNVFRFLYDKNSHLYDNFCLFFFLISGCHRVLWRI